MIKIAIADDHPMITDGLRLILSMHQHILLENTYSNGTELMSGMQIKQPDVLLLDIQFPETTGDHLLPLLLKTYPNLRILVLTGIDSALYIHNMLRDGARGYVLKNSASAVIVTAIETVYRGEIYLEDTLQRKLELFKDKIKYKESLKPTLTPKELEILKYTLKGYTLQQMSEVMFLGRRTVEYYRSNLFLKLDVKNMAELIRKAIETGIAD